MITNIRMVGAIMHTMRVHTGIVIDTQQVMHWTQKHRGPNDERSMDHLDLG